MKIIQINGFRGMVTAAFIGICLFAGFVLFPGLVAMNLWNKYLASAYMLPVLNLFQGVLIWAMIATSYAIVTKKDMAVSFRESKDLTPYELDMIIKKAKASAKFRAINQFIQKDFEKTFNSTLLNENFHNNIENQENNTVDEKKISNLK